MVWVPVPAQEKRYRSKQMNITFPVGQAGPELVPEHGDGTRPPSGGRLTNHYGRQLDTASQTVLPTVATGPCLLTSLLFHATAG